MNCHIGEISLAPMEGVIDSTIRTLLTNRNTYDYCVTEFIRVIDQKIPKHMFYRIAPELKKQGCTESNTPVKVQLLGQSPDWMAENANVATQLGAKGIDLNFGCPAPTVNKSKGGAVLLKDPEKIYAIIVAVRKAVEDYKQPVSVKIRLGYDDTSLLTEIIQAINDAKPNLITIHARTKKQGYKPPAYWQSIGDVNSINNIETCANGEIWSKHDALNCIKTAKTKHIMLGRGALALPNLCNVIKYNEPPMTWSDVCLLLLKYAEIASPSANQYYYPSRLKQWLKYLKLQYTQADHFFNNHKKVSDKYTFIKLLEQEV